MIRKSKQPPASNVRHVRPQQRANVFSYYASRSSSDQPAVRRPDVSQTVARPSLRLRLDLLPALFAILALVFCLVYVSTLSSKPKLVLSGTDVAARTMLSATDTYESNMQDVFDASVQNRSKLLINTDEVAAQLEEAYPELGEISIILPLVGRRPVVQAQPQRPALILTTGDTAYAVDQNGRIGIEATQVPTSVRESLAVLQDQSGVELTQGQHALSRASTQFVADVFYQLQAAKISVRSMVLTNSPDEMHIRIKDKPYFIKFNLRGSSRAQAGTYLATAKKLQQDNHAPKEYIDVRVPGKVFYK